MKIADRLIGKNQKPYLIAEMSNNHLKDIGKAYEIIEAAKSAGADAIKIQTYTADSLTIDSRKSDFYVPNELWKGRTYYELYQEISMPLKWNELLFKKANDVGITIFSSPFDESSVDLLEELETPAYKVASFESKDPYFLAKIASTKKPVILSTGISTFADIVESCSILKKHGAGDVAVLHCTSGYPTEPSEMNIAVLSKLQELHCDAIGLSDHTLTDTASLMSIALGGSIIEKHFTLKRSDGGPDAAFSLEPDEFATLRRNVDEAAVCLGHQDSIDDIRLGSHFARSLYFVTNKSAGEIIRKSDIRIIRPGFGLEPKHRDSVIGARLTCDVECGDRVTWDILDLIP